jgi:ribonucleoside-diphosphate reductase alpha chain
MEKESVRSAERREERPVGSTGTRMQVQAQRRALEPVDLNKIVRAVQRCARGSTASTRCASPPAPSRGLYDGASTSELDELSIQTAAALISEEPNYSQARRAPARTVIDKEVQNQDIYSFSQSIALGHAQGPHRRRDRRDFVAQNAASSTTPIDPERNWLFEYFGLRTVYDRYLLRTPSPQGHRDAAVLLHARRLRPVENPDEAIELYRAHLLARVPAELADAVQLGHAHEQLSSCFLLDSPEDTSTRIYKRYTDVALLSKFAGGIGLAYTACARRGSLIRGTNGLSNGIVPWLKTLDASVAAVNQGGKRKGAAASTSRPGTPTSRSSSSCATTPATRRAAPTT